MMNKVELVEELRRESFAEDAISILPNASRSLMRKIAIYAQSTWLEALAEELIKNTHRLKSDGSNKLELMQESVHKIMEPGFKMQQVLLKLLEGIYDNEEIPEGGIFKEYLMESGVGIEIDWQDISVNNIENKTFELLESLPQDQVENVEQLFKTADPEDLKVYMSIGLLKSISEIAALEKKHLQKKPPLPYEEICNLLDKRIEAVFEHYIYIRDSKPIKDMILGKAKKSAAGSSKGSVRSAKEEIDSLFISWAINELPPNHGYRFPIDAAKDFLERFLKEKRADLYKISLTSDTPRRLVKKLKQYCQSNSIEHPIPS